MRARSAVGLLAILISIDVQAATTCGPQVTVGFYEGAPKDQFVIRNASAPGWEVSSIEVLLTGSRGRLLFDTEAGGPGLNVYQPFELNGSGASPGTVRIEDGAEQLALSFPSGQRLTPGRSLAFTIDVDDRVELADLGPAVISGNEIEGASVRAEVIGPGGQSTVLEAVFDRTGQAVSPPLACS